MPLDKLYLEWTKVTDLSPLTNCPIRYMSIIGTQVSNLMPLAGMPLKALFLQDSSVTDLSPLSGCPLEFLVYSESTVTNGIKAIREISTLEAINDMDAADFWRNYDRQMLAEKSQTGTSVGAPESRIESGEAAESAKQPAAGSD